jgi:hypothetical protein
MTNVFDIFFKKFAYKFPKGYPDMKNDQDALLLEQLINKLGVVIALEEARVEVSKLKNRPERRKVIINKIWDKSPFKLIDGTELLVSDIIIDGEKFSAANAEDKDKATTALVTVSKLSFDGTVDGVKKSVSANNLEKTPELGGKGAGSTTTIETSAMTDLDAKIKELGTVDIKIGNEIYPNITGVKNTPGVPKSDFELYDENGKSLIFISHKDCCNARDFQQYGGVSAFKSDSEVQSFVAAIKKELGGDQMVRGGGFKRKVESDEIKLKSIYGLNYGSGFNKDNVQIVCQGEINLVPVSDSVYTLKSDHDILNGTIPGEGYTPYFMATFRSDRNDLGIKQARLGVYPVATRPSAVEI